MPLGWVGALKGAPPKLVVLLLEFMVELWHVLDSLWPSLVVES